ncbi:MAG: hypothetical protein OXT67_01870 [Zetaproteobacteria bacterium]|nr:hypothetical protein [Zetaproteobacteria bacterium]
MESEERVHQRFPRYVYLSQPPGRLRAYPSGREIPCTVRDYSEGGIGIQTAANILPDIEFCLETGEVNIPLILVWGDAADGSGESNDEEQNMNRYGFRVPGNSQGIDLLEVFRDDK